MKHDNDELIKMLVSSIKTVKNNMESQEEGR
jgi:hypothetical protein